MRVLHLIDAASDQATATTLALLGVSLGRLEGVDDHLLLLGGRSLAAEAALADLPPERVERLAVPFGRAWAGRSMLRRWLRRVGRFDLIHCWSVGAVSQATFTVRHTPRLLSLTHSPSRRAVHWLRMLVDGPLRVLAVTNTIRRAVLGGGVVESSVAVLRPGIDLGMVQYQQRQSLRSCWGLDPVRDPQVKVVALLSDPPAAADAKFAALAAGIAADSRPEIEMHLLLHPDQHNRRRAEDMLLAVRLRRPIIRDPQVAAPWRSLPACDVALACGDAGGGLSLLWAMAANVPIVGQATYAISEMVEDRHSSLLAKPPAVRDIAYRIGRIFDDPQLAWQIRDTARHEAYSFFSPARYRKSLRRVYEQFLTGQPLEVEAMEATGGLRFSGRA